MDENAPPQEEPAENTADTPPKPTLTGKPLVEERTFTPHQWLDYSLGILSTLVGFLVISLALYFIFRNKYPVYTRGIIHGFIGIGILFLGAFTICLINIGGF